MARFKAWLRCPENSQMLLIIETLVLIGVTVFLLVQTIILTNLAAQQRSTSKQTADDIAICACHIPSIETYTHISANNTQNTNSLLEVTNKHVGEITALAQGISDNVAAISQDVAAISQDVAAISDNVAAIERDVGFIEEYEYIEYEDRRR